MLQSLYEFTEEVESILTISDKNVKDFLEQFSDMTSEKHLSYLMVIFTHLNKLNLKFQGSGNRHLEVVANMFIFKDKLRTFICKLQLWIS